MAFASLFQTETLPVDNPPVMLKVTGWSAFAFLVSMTIV